MTEKEVIKKLKEMECESGIAEIVCDVINVNTNEVRTNETILVMLCGYGEDDSACDDDQIVNANHWDVFKGIKDFKKHKDNEIVFKITNFSQVREFVSDFATYKCLGYYNNVDAVMMSDFSADQVVDAMKQGKGQFLHYDDEYQETKEYLMSNKFAKLTDDGKYLVTYDVADRFGNVPLDLVAENAQDEFINIYMLEE